MRNSSKGLVSIVVPCFNAESFLAETLESAVNQTYSNIEVLVIDDSSNDGSLDIARAFQGPRLKVLKQSRRGAGSARNVGIQESQGEFIQFLDADDLLDYRKIEVQVKRLRRLGFRNAIASSTFWAFTKSKTDARQRELPIYRVRNPIDFLICSWNGGGFMQTAGWLTPRDLVDRTGPWMTRQCPNDDGEYFTRILLASTSVEFCSDAVFYYRLPRPGSLANARSPAQAEALLWSLEASAERLLAVRRTAESIEACRRILGEFAISYYPTFPKLIKRAEDFLVRIGAGSVEYPDSRWTGPLAQLIGWKATRIAQHYGGRIYHAICDRRKSSDEAA